MKNIVVSSSVPNIKNIPRMSDSPTKPNNALTQNTLSTTKTTQNTPSPQITSVPGLTGLESTEGNYASHYIPPNESILAEYAFAEEVYKKNKRKYQHMLVEPAIQHIMVEGQKNTEYSEILFKP